MTFVLLIAIAFFVYGFIGIIGESYTMKNILTVSAGFLGFMGLLYKMIRDNNDDKVKIANKRQEVYRRLRDKYDNYTTIKSFINDNLDRNGMLKEKPYRNDNNRPTKVEVEDFMRFFKDLKWELDCQNIDWKTAKEKFSKYALIVYQIT